MASAPSYTVDASPNGFIEQVKLLAHVPLNQRTYTAEQLLALGDNELRTSLLRQILQVREGYYLTWLEYDVNSAGSYAIPPRAIGGRVHSIQLRVGTAIYPLSRIEPMVLTNTETPPTNSYGFWFEGNRIVTLPKVTSGKLRIYYYVRPSNLTSQTNCALVQSISGNNVTVAALPSGYTVGKRVDMTQAQPPFGILATDSEITAINTLTLTLSSVPEELAEGDWVSLAGTTCIPQIPLEFVPLLCQRVAVKVLEGQGYLPKMQMAQRKLEEMERDVLSIINPRDEGNPKVITPSRGLISPGPARRGRWFVGV
jgi:hypothetical protein